LILALRRQLYLALLLGLAPSVAFAHGGLPLSETIIYRDGQLVVPTYFWGVFFGTDGGPWRWICEEAINTKRDRRWALSGDGTYHVTDNKGVQSSRDGGCTWVAATGELADSETSTVVADPVDPKRAWATAFGSVLNDAGMSTPQGALFTTPDDGVTWTKVLAADEYFNGVALSSDGKHLYVVGWTYTTMANLFVHVSHDGGMTWNESPVTYAFTYTTDGGTMTMNPSQVEPSAVDPADPTVVYLRAFSDPAYAMLRGTKEGTVLTEIARSEGGPSGFGMGTPAFDGKGNVFVPAQEGLFFGPADGTMLQKTSNLSQAQCVLPHGNSIYACSWNYQPDNAAIARSDDGGKSFTKVFQYDQTVGPITTCPADSPVGKTCPDIWINYAVQLGIGAGDMGTSPPPPPSCSCGLATRATAKGALLGFGVTLLVVVQLLRRKAARPA
jgi:hypothetical protein